MTSGLKVLIADDHQLFAQGLSSGLSARFVVCGISSSAEHVLRDVDQLEPDVLLLDVSLGSTNGLKLIRLLLQARPALKIVIVTMHSDSLLAQTAFRAGAHAFVPKDSGLADLTRAIEAASRGERYLSAGVRCHAEPEQGLSSLTAGLTPRQREVVMMIGDGCSSAVIAASLAITLPTVAFHRQRVRAALGLKSEWDLVRYAILVRANTK